MLKATKVRIHPTDDQVIQLALGISATANRGSVNPKGSGRKKSTNSEVFPSEVGSPRLIA